MKKTIYILSRGLFYALTVFFCFIFIFSILAFVEHYFGWNIPFVGITNVSGIDQALIYPPLLNGTIQFPISFLVALVMWIGLLFYVAYFYTLKEFFRVFIEDEVFNHKSLKRLKAFFYINLIPIIYALGLSVFQIIKNGHFKFEEDQGIAIFHLLIAFLVYLYMDLLKRGKVLQEENDLTI